jgi:hypothetical protein
MRKRRKYQQDVFFFAFRYEIPDDAGLCAQSMGGILL